jgi:hypothetical protein
MVKAAEDDEREADTLAREAVAMTKQQAHDIKEANDVSFRALMTLFREQVVQREVASRCVSNREQRLAK